MTPAPRASLAAIATAALLSPFGIALDGAEPVDRTIDNVVARAERDPVAYRAMRHLEARSARANAWLDARTEFDSVAGFRYSIIDEGGSGRIRNSVLKAVLNAEKEASSPGECRRGALSTANYEIQPEGPDGSGALKLRLIPRRKDSRLVDGALFVSPITGEPLRLEGQLAKSPSFWIKSVDVSWRYARVGSVVMPVEVESQAQVKMFGSSSFVMTYDYEMVDGRPVE